MKALYVLSGETVLVIEHNKVQPGKFQTWSRERRAGDVGQALRRGWNRKQMEEMALTPMRTGRGINHLLGK